MKHQLVDSGAEVMVIFAHSLEEIVAPPPVKHIVITELGNQLGGMKRTVVNGVIRYIKKMVPRYHLPTAVSFGAALKKGSQRFFQRVTPQGDNTAFLQYTGGTTGVSKGAVLSHTNIVANVEQFSAWLSVHLRLGAEL